MRPKPVQAELMRLVVVIPAYNEEATIADVIRAVPRSVPGIDTVSVAVIDDGSTDATAKRARAAGAYVASHGGNLGLAEAFRTAVRVCLELDADIAISIDADLQFSPQDIPTLVEPIRRGEADFVAANRFGNGGIPEHMPWIKYQGNRLMSYAVSKVSGRRFADVSSGYRAYSREALLHLNVQGSFTYTQETFIELAAKGLRIAQVPVEVRYFPERRSRISANVLRYGLRTFLTIARTTRDYAPLTVFFTGALVVMFPSILIGLFVLAHFALTGSFSPYIFLAFTAAYLFTLGLALLVVGLVADMLRAIRNNQERLLYFAKRERYVNGGSPNR